MVKWLRKRKDLEHSASIASKYSPILHTFVIDLCPYCPGYTEPIPQKTDNNVKEIDLEDTDESTPNCNLDDMNKENYQTSANDDDDCSDVGSSVSEYNSESDGPEVWNSDDNDEAHGNDEDTRIESESSIEACRISRKAEQFVWIIFFYISPAAQLSAFRAWCSDDTEVHEDVVQNSGSCYR